MPFWVGGEYNTYLRIMLEYMEQTFPRAIVRSTTRRSQDGGMERKGREGREGSCASSEGVSEGLREHAGFFLWLGEPSLS